MPLLSVIQCCHFSVISAFILHEILRVVLLAYDWNIFQRLALTVMVELYLMRVLTLAVLAARVFSVTDILLGCPWAEWMLRECV